MIISEVVDYLGHHHKAYFEGLTIEKVCMGMHMSAVQLSDGSCGVSGTLTDSAPRHAPGKKERDFGDFTPNHITGKKVWDLLNTTKQSNLVDTLRVGVLNAVSSALQITTKHKMLEDTDPVDLVRITPHTTITLVGAFQSYIRKISAISSRLHVLEMKEEALPGAFRQHYVPADEFPKVIPGSDVVIITGLTLVNGTIDGLLSAVKPGTTVVVTGPSANIMPDVLFANKVSIIGATRITDREKLFSTVAEGGAGYHLFRYCARKICMVKE